MSLMKCMAGPAEGPHRTCAAPYPELLSADAVASLQPLPAGGAEPRVQLNDVWDGPTRRCGWWNELQALAKFCCIRSRQTGMQSDPVQLCERCILRQAGRSTGSSEAPH